MDTQRTATTKTAHSATLGLITTPEQLTAFISSVNPAEPMAVDTETSGLDEAAPDATLLGISLSDSANRAVYIVLHTFNREANLLSPTAIMKNPEPLARFLGSLQYAVGANYAFDGDWILKHLGVAVNFRFDTQIAWHHTDAPYSQRSYGLKALQKDLLGWPTANDGALHANIKANGGPAEGGFYYADIEVLGEYAALDALATYMGYAVLNDKMQADDYMAFHDRTASYRGLLRWGTREGMPVDVAKLSKWIQDSEQKLGQLADAFNVAVGPAALQELHLAIQAKALGKYTSQRGRENYLKGYSAPPINLDSNPQLSKLFYGVLGEEILEWTKARQPAVHATALARMSHPAAKVLVERNSLQKCLEYARAYLEHTKADGRIHASFNATGTLSGRASGFSPNLHQMPIGETALMECFPVQAGRVGVGADLTSIEPFFTAYFSEDSTMLKVYRDKLGDIYLDLALDLFPDNTLLAERYNPRTVPDSEVKQQFNTERQVAKLVHLASAYGAGGRKIAEILSQNGHPTTEDEGKRLHRLYWQKFKKIKELEAGLYELVRQDGSVTNLFGRIIRLPDLWCKDLLNRFIQSTGHDALIEWIFEINRLRQERKVDMVPYLLDWHDATYWHVPEAQKEAGMAILRDALATVSARLELPFPINCVAKSFYTLAEIK
jgi:DNA polymerase-1